MTRALLLAIPPILLLTACSSPKYACGVPNGIGCKPISEVQRMAQSGALKAYDAPDQRTTNSTSTPRSDLEKLAKRDTTQHDQADQKATDQVGKDAGRPQAFSNDGRKYKNPGTDHDVDHVEAEAPHPNFSFKYSFRHS